MAHDRGLSSEAAVTRVCSIRTAELSDLPSLLRLLALMHDEERDWPPKRHELAILERTLAQPGRSMFVATENDNVVGTADLLVVENLSRGGRPWAIVENVVVDPRARRRGHGRRLMEQAISVAREADCYKVQLVSNRKRDAAHHLYRALGFDAAVSGFRKYLVHIE